MAVSPETEPLDLNAAATSASSAEDSVDNKGEKSDDKSENSVEINEASEEDQAESENNLIPDKADASMDNVSEQDKEISLEASPLNLDTSSDLSMDTKETESTDESSGTTSLTSQMASLQLESPSILPIDPEKELLDEKLDSSQGSTPDLQQDLNPDSRQDSKPDLKLDPQPFYIKSLRLPSAVLQTLPLTYGANRVRFVAERGGTCSCKLFKWKSTDQLVISDIDGTITKSDVFGHLFTMVGKDWTQLGVAKLFTKIKENGYKLIYLTSRAIGQVRKNIEDRN